jgi:peptidoglycan/LPS O-acetylase OafA/YrhL
MKSDFTESGRLEYMDAVRAFALLLGVAFHASLSFISVPIGWAVMDVSTSPHVGNFIVISHSFRMPLFFLVAGFFSHLSFHRKGGVPFLRSRLLRLAIPFVAGWFILWPLIASGWIMGAESMRGTVDIAAGLKGGFAMLLELPRHFLVSTHLWFLYYLLLITGLVIATRLILSATGRKYGQLVRGVDRGLEWLAGKPFSLIVFAVPTARVVWEMRGWGLDTPDQSLVPHLPVLLIYGSCFVLGWLLHRNRESFERLTSLTPTRVCLTILACGLSAGLSRIQGDPSHPQFMLMRGVFAVSYSLMMWGLVFQVIGAMRLLIKRRYPAVRFVADASYWIYLIHLPVVVWLQVALAEWPLHWSIKLLLVTMMTILIALATYYAFVRSTWIGTVLAGRRQEKSLPVGIRMLSRST